MKMEKKANKKAKIWKTVFYIFLIGSILIDILILLQAYDPCRINLNKECSLAYQLVGSTPFLYIIWIQNILAILISIIYIIISIIDKKWKNVLLGILGIITPAIVWTSTLGALNIIWGF